MRWSSGATCDWNNIISNSFPREGSHGALKICASPLGPHSIAPPVMLPRAAAAAAALARGAAPLISADALHALLARGVRAPALVLIDAQFGSPWAVAAGGPTGPQAHAAARIEAVRAPGGMCV